MISLFPISLESDFFIYLYIYIYFLYYTWCIPGYFLYSFTHYSAAKNREDVVQGIPYERTVHTFIPYIALDCLFEHPRSLVREIYGSPHIPILELLFHFSIVPFGVQHTQSTLYKTVFVSLFLQQKMRNNNRLAFQQRS